MNQEKMPQFELVIEHDNFIVRDHRVHDVRVLPGVTLLDLTYRLGQEVLSHTAFELGQILFKQPIVTHKAFDQKLRVSFEMKADRVWQVRVRSQKVKEGQAIAEAWIEIMQCDLFEQVSVDQRPAFDVARFIELSDRQWDMAQVYELARSVDIWHGPFMKTRGAVYQKQNERLMVLHLSELAEEFRDKFYAHPAFLDGATLAGLPVGDHGAGFSSDNTPYIPFSIRRFGVYEPFPQTIYVYSQSPEIEKTADSPPDLLTSDITIYNEKGGAIAEFNDLMAKRIREARLIKHLVRQERPREENDRETSGLAPFHIDKAPAAWDTEDERSTSVAKSDGPAGKDEAKAAATIYLQQQTADILGRSVAEVNPHTPFYELGLDSTNLLAVTKTLETHYGLELYPTLLFEYTTIAELAEYLSQADGAHARPRQPARSTPVVAGSELGQSFEKSFYRPVWETELLADQPDPEPTSPLILLYSPDKQAIRALKKEITNQPGQTGHWIFVGPGKRYQRVGDNHYVLNPESEAAWSRLITTLTEKSQIPGGVVFLSMQAVDEVETYLKRHLYPLFQLAGSLIKTKSAQEIQLLYLYQGWETLAACFEQAVSGFGKTLEQESTKFRFKIIGLENNSTALLSTLIRQEMVAEASQAVHYRAGKRWVQNLQTCTSAVETATVPLLRKHGTYIMTGGSGGIGLILAEGLLRTYEANLILVGRSPLSADKAHRFEQLNRLGAGTLTYRQADITSLEETGQLVNQTKSQFGKIHGVIHAAGVIQDTLIPHKTLPELRAVIAPKVMGALNLDRVLAAEALDLFVLFSSATAIWGHIGQADYSYANGFLDSFSGYRQRLVEQGQRHGQTLSINWPLWENGGMQTTPQARQALIEAGLQPLDDQTGWQAFEMAVNQREFDQLVFLWQRRPQEAAEEAGEIGDPSERMPLTPPRERNGHPPVSSEKKRVKQGSTYNANKDIAIIGLSGRYPQAETLAEFWQNLKAGRNCITEIPQERWDYRPYYDPDKDKSGQSYSKWGGFIDDVDKFDPRFFNISPREAERMDPQERLFLETAWATVEDAGYSRATLANVRHVGVFVGVMYHHYPFVANDFTTAATLGSLSYWQIANRVSYVFNLQGPSLAIDTACSSSLTAIYLACESIKRGECQMALAGGVNLSLHPAKWLMLSQAQLMGSEDKSKSLGDGDGFLPGEGVGAVLLKRLDQAIADNDPIYAVIKGGVLNHGGKTSGFMVPNPNAQADLIRETFEKTGVDPETISYIEVAANGSALGDPIEIAGLSKAFQPASHRQGQWCPIGSVKSNIGHLEAASGISQLTKVILQLKYKTLVPSINADPLNPNLQLERTPFYIQKEVQTWQRPEIEQAGEIIELPRRAAISSFGVGGANAHLVIEEYQAPGARRQELEKEQPYVIVLSARNKERLKAYAARLLACLEPASSLVSIAYTLQVGREAMNSRVAFVATDIRTLREKLTQYLAGEAAIGQCYQGQVKQDKESINIFSSDEDSRALIRQWLAKGKLEKLAAGWVKGLEIEWSLLYGPEKPDRISLPTYPFARERYWIFDDEPSMLVPSNGSSERDQWVAGMSDEETVTPQDFAARAASEQTKPGVLNRVPAEPTPTQEQGTDDAHLLAKKIQADLIKSVAATLKIRVEEIGGDEPLNEYGFDSITLTELINKLNETYQLDLMPTVFFEHNTLESLSTFLADQFPDILAHHYQISPNSTRAPGQPPSSRLSKPRLRPYFTEARPKPNEEIAIIGISGMMPGSPDLETFWRHLEAGQNLITEIPPDRWDWRAYDGDPLTETNKTRVKWGGFIPDVDKFDAAFFKISPREASLMDPQQRIFLETVWKCIEDAGYPPQALSGTDTGLFVGVGKIDYQELLHKRALDIQAHMGTGLSCAILANRISYLLDIHGPSEPIDTACSSSLIAIHRAVQAIHNGQCGLAIAGGVNVILTPAAHLAFTQAGMLAEDGRCKTFDRQANGYVRGEGVGAVLLKPLSQAEADGDHIYAIIRGSAENHGGRTSSLTAPNPNAQAALLVSAYQQAQIDPATVSYIETHGTGTKLGDPIEINGLKMAFARLYQQWNLDKPASPHCGLGAVKTNIGHLEPAAGIAGLLKVLLAMKHKKLPASINFNEQNPYIDLKDSPFYLVTETQPWQPLTDEQGNAIPRRAGVSSFGFGGSNAHVVLEEYEGAEAQGSRGAGEMLAYSVSSAPQRLNASAQLIVLSAKNEERLKIYAQKLVDFLTESPDISLTDLAYTLQVGREAMEARLALVVDNESELRHALANYVAGKAESEQFFAGQLTRQKRRINLSNDDEDAGALVTTWLRKGKLAKLAELWVEGIEVDWTLLYEAEKPRRISLPTYPFARERHWIPINEQLTMNNEQTVSSSNSLQSFNVAPDGPSAFQLHPLVHQNTSDLEQQRFSSVFSGDEFFLRDHKVTGVRMLPGVAYLEMVRAAGDLAVKDKVVTHIRNVIWASPIIVGDRAVETHCSLYPEAADRAAFEISTTTSDDQPAIHARGSLIYSLSPGDPQVINLEAIRQRCMETMSKERCYRLFKQHALDYGPSFQVIEELVSHEAEVLARLSLPSERAIDNPNAFVLHPSLMDGALQAAIGLSRMGNQDATLKLPFAVREITIVKALPERVYAYVKYSQGVDPQADVVKYDIAIADEQGEVCILFKEFMARVLGQPSGQVTKPEVDGLIYCTPIWQPRQIDESGVDLNRNPATMDQQTLANALMIVAGADPHLVESITSTFEQAEVLALPEPGPDVAESVRSNIHKLWQKIKSILEDKSKAKRQLLLLVPEALPGYIYTPLTGLLKTAQLEHPKIRGKLLILPEPETANIMAIIQSEIQPDTFQDGEVRYGANGRREVKQLVEIEPDPVSNEGTRFNSNGVYWITGGLGGLGRIFARYLVEQSDEISVVLSGRSALDESRQQQLAELRQTGSTIEYVQADVSRRQDVEAVVSHIRAEYGQLDGIIHSAGILRDSIIVTKSADEIEAVLAPKVAGILNIDTATQADPLDFLILFSSIAGLTGNIGQGDYAVASAFLNGFAAHRQQLVDAGERQGRTITINWPLWQDGGMQQDEETKKWIVDRTGISPLATKLGLQAFGRILAQQQYGQMAVVQGEVEKIRRNLALVHTGSDPAASSSTPITKPEPVTAGTSTLPLEEDLIDLCVALLNVDRANLDVEIEFLEYGVDSILMMRMLDKLEEKYGLPIEPNAILEYPTIRSFAGYLASLGVTGQAVSHPDPLPQGKRQPASRLLEQEALESQAISRLSAPRSKPRARFSQVDGRPTSGKVAIIGQACRLPQSPTTDHFWANLAAGRDLVTHVPPGRWPADDVYSPNNGHAAQPYYGGFIDKIAYFDANLFNIPDDQALTMDPQQRFMLELAQTLLDSAGYSPQELAHTNTSIFIGGKDNNYVRNFSHLIPETSLQHSVVNSISNMVAARISDFYDLTGTSQMIDTACSSSLVAVHDACQSILRGESALAIAGGIHLMVDAYTHIGFSQAKVLSADGKSYVFDERAKGIVLGEGGGLVMLKEYEAALRDGDQILGVILGSAVNNDGKTMGVTVPNQAGQKAVIEAALKRSHITPDLIGYLEAHGTGTLLGDPIEIRAATEVYRQYTQERQYCAVGSVKSNLGHTMTAAGITGLIKLILSLQHQQIPATLHCEKPHPRFGFNESPFYPNTGLRDWEPRNGRRIGAISSFGFGGTNCHMIVEEGTQPHPIRRPLPPTQFKRKRYWLGTPIVPEEQISGRAYHAQLLDQLDQGEIDEQQIEVLIFANRP